VKLAHSAALVGCGMVGGSLMAALRAAGAVERVVGYDRDAAHAEAARARGLVDQVAGDAAAAVRGAELVVLAVPVRATAEVLGAIAGAVGDAQLVTDVGSTKSDVLAAAEAALPDPSRFCGSHPMAGTEKSGPGAAEETLFVGKLALLTPGARTSEVTHAACKAMWTAAGARTRTMTAEAHDRAMAWVSHLPHAVAFALAASVGAVAGEVAGLSGGGFTDTTRIAASDAAMWRDIFVSNRAALLDALDAYAGELAALRRAVDSGDTTAIESLVARARDGRARVMK
jgi:prephenate dehydrogenase